MLRYCMDYNWISLFRDTRLSRLRHLAAYYASYHGYHIVTKTVLMKVLSFDIMSKS